METKIYNLLSKVLDPELSEDLTQYISELDSASDYEEYMKHILDFSIKNQRDLYEELRSMKFGVKVTKPKVKTNEGNSSKKVDIEVSPVDKKKKGKTFSKFQIHELSQGYLKEGRMPCECQAARHKLINNCTECGRIVCEQEGSGPCFFCESMVCTKDESEILNSNTKTADALYRALTERKKSETWKKAMQHRNILLESDKNSAQINKIIDDEHDYFEINNKWLSKKEREKAVKKQKQNYDEKYGSRLGPRKFNLDLSGKQLIESTLGASNFEEDEEELIEVETVYDQVILPDIDSVLRALKEMPDPIKPKKVGIIKDEDDYVIQDKGYLEMRDMGLCLSMHQPWASLLMAGIKQHEGRTWYTPHRGPLWIAAASKSPEAADIETCRQFYTAYHKGATIEFPSEYVTGCLLGRLTVEECRAQPEYRQLYPDGESDSPFVLICSYPQMLPIPLPMQGDHKIYKMKSVIFKQAREALVIRRRMI